MNMNELYHRGEKNAMHNPRNMHLSCQMIDSRSELILMTEQLAREKVIAFDIECASNLHHYINRVCLMQFAARNSVFVVDALKELDLEPIGRLLEDPAIEIVMHDTDFDLRSLDRHYGWRPKNLFDTLIAARLCGHREFGLGPLLEKHFGKRRSKKFQRADWTIRPLPHDMLEYASADVACLERLRDLLAKELEKLGRTAWARAKFKQCEEKRFEPDERPLFARVKNARELCNDRELAVLNELVAVRDDIARDLDLPHFMVMADAVLIALAKDQPRTTHELALRRGMHPECRRKYAERLVSAVIKGLSAPALKWPLPERNERQREYSTVVFDALKAWRTGYAKQLDIEPELILSMNSLRKMAAGTAIDDILHEEAVGTWRFDEIKQALKKITDPLYRAV